MDVFKIQETLVNDYKSYVESFVSIRDPFIRQFVQNEYDKGRYWPEALVQLNPAFSPGPTVPELVANGTLHDRCGDIFRAGKDPESGNRGIKMRLHTHQQDAIEIARGRASYVLTTGTGSGKSLAYFIPIVDRVLRQRSGSGLKAIVVYPMNALCNSQLDELEKFLGPSETSPVTYQRYTGQEDDEARNRIRANPPDILLTNYVMLELILTRAEDKPLLDKAGGLEFLVLDELHTYRGRQGADVAMLVRRLRERTGVEHLQCVGTSATMATDGSYEDRQARVAEVATTLFGTEVMPERVIGETLQPLFPDAVHNDDELRRAGDEVVAGTIPADPRTFLHHPLAAWIETTYGTARHDGRFERVTPLTITEGAERLHEQMDLPVNVAAIALRSMLMQGFRLKHPDTNRPIFAFRLHQFISRGDTVFSTLELSDDRYLTLDGQTVVPGDHDRRLYPLCFCRACGEAYFTVDIPEDQGAQAAAPREFRDLASQHETDRTSGYIWLDPAMASDHQLQSGELTIQGYYQELLRLVYRLLFLMVAEERHLLFRVDADAQVVTRYARHYSVERLRREASRIRNREGHYDDLWLGLLVTFDAMRFPKEANALGIGPLAGGLFGPGSCPHVADDTTPDATAGTSTNGLAKTDGRPRLSNAALLAAVTALSDVTRDGVTRRVNYRDLDVEELGGVYEGLLDHQPALEPLANGSYRFAYGASGERKSTGSYYTPRSLVQELLNSALDPVIDQALANTKTPDAKRRALLALNVCDPACGSGHFLLGAARRIGRRLAEVKAGPGNEPDLADVRHGVREAIRRCIYGVDKNPLAIDLCKVALWIESHEPGAPISFLDNHIKRGDSLIGVFDLDVLQSGIPDAAYTAVTGDDKKVAADLKKRNKTERPKVHDDNGRQTTVLSLGLWQDNELESLQQSLAAALNTIESMPDGTIGEVTAKQAAYERVQGRADWRDMTTACTLWTSAFFAPLSAANMTLVPTSSSVRQMVNSGNVRGDMLGPAIAAAEEVGFFHWPLQFPEVFAQGGFDTVLGNPPWERVKLQEKEFFGSRDPEIATAANKAARDRLIKRLVETNPSLSAEFKRALSTAENASLFLRTSERYPLTGRGDVNLYSVFAELDARAIRKQGRTGIIVPTGLATDDTNKHFFSWLVEDSRLVSLFDFENKLRIFPSVAPPQKFCLLTMSGGPTAYAKGDFAFYCQRIEEIQDPARHVALSREDFLLLNPNTLTCPIFRNARDADLTKVMYRTVPVLLNERHGEADNAWEVTFKTMFHMSNDSGLFRTRENLESDGWTLTGNTFTRCHESFLPLYEPKLFHQYNHRLNTFEGVPIENRFNVKAFANAISTQDLKDPNVQPIPRYWVEEDKVLERVTDAVIPAILAFRNIVNVATNRRTSVFTFLPMVAANHAAQFVISRRPSLEQAALLANFNSFVLDFCARQKLGGANFSYFIVKQLPIVPPETYTKELLAIITPRVLELTYTAHDMAPFARDLGYEGEPFIWDEERRAKLRADLDGIYAHLYGISRDDFAYILDTFPIVARKDIAEFGEYRTKRLCLEAYDHFSPETLRKLELHVREIELALRRTIVRALDGDVDALPSHIKSKLLDEYAKHSPNGDGAPSLRTLLDSSYLTDLEKIIRSDGVWSTVGDQFGSKSRFRGYVSDLNDFRNPMAHNRGVSEDVREKGETAVAWFTEALQGQMLRA